MQRGKCSDCRREGKSTPSILGTLSPCLLPKIGTQSAMPAIQRSDARLDKLPQSKRRREMVHPDISKPRTPRREETLGTRRVLLDHSKCRAVSWESLCRARNWENVTLRVLLTDGNSLCAIWGASERFSPELASCSRRTVNQVFLPIVFLR